MARVLHSVQGVEERFVRGKRRHRGRREERVVREDVTGGNYEGTSHSSSVVSLLFLLSIRFFFFFRGNNFPLGTRHYSKFCATPLSRRRCLKSANAALSLLSLLLVVRDSPFLLPSSLFTTQANDFYVKTETRLRGQLDILEEEIKHEKTDVERFKSAKKQIVKHFAPELSELRSFVILNYTAVVKAVKKYNKNCNKRENAVEIIRDVRCSWIRRWRRW